MTEVGQFDYCGILNKSSAQSAVLLFRIYSFSFPWSRTTSLGLFLPSSLPILEVKNHTVPPYSYIYIFKHFSNTSGTRLKYFLLVTMNCPSRTDEPLENDGWNQNPPPLAADLTTRQDLNGLVNRRTQHDSILSLGDDRASDTHDRTLDPHLPRADTPEDFKGKPNADVQAAPLAMPGTPPSSLSTQGGSGTPPKPGFPGWLQNWGNILNTFAKFVGPGFMGAVA